MKFTPAIPRFTSIALTAMLSLSVVSVSASDGTSGTLPESFHECEIVTANWSPEGDIPEASPVASPIASPVASPMASPVASPVVAPVLDAEDDTLVSDLEVASAAILDCISDNNAEVLTEVTGGQFRGSWLGLGVDVSDADLEVLLQMMPSLPYQLVSIEDASADGDTATATVQFTKGRQLLTTEWTYQLAEIDGENVWTVQEEVYQPTASPDRASVLQLTVEDGAFTFDALKTQPGDIVINVQNVGAVPHEVLIVRAPAGTEAADFAAAPSGLPSGSTFIGQVTLLPGAEGSIVLTDVREGSYTVVDLLPDGTGMPNVSSGMIIEFVVEQP